MQIVFAMVVGGAVAAVSFWGGYMLRARRMRSTLADDPHMRTRLRNLTAVVEQSPSTVMITDLDGRIEYVNPRFTTLTGYTAAEAYGQKPSILSSGQTSPETYAKMWATVASGGTWRGEFLNKKKNGELYWESVSIAGVADEHGTLTHYVSVKEDITERKRLEEALQRNEVDMRAMLAVVPDLVFRFNRDGVCLDARGNAGNGLLVGATSPDEAVGQSIFEMLPEAQARLIHQTISRTLETGITQTVEYSLATGGGTTDFEARMAAINADEVISVARDVTERRMLEAALHANEVKYRSVSERANDAILIVQDGLIRYANPQLSHMLEWELSAIIDQPFEKFIAPQSREMVHTRYQRRMRGEQVVERYEAQLQHISGSVLDVEINSSLMNYEGRPAALAFVRDITEQKRAEAERERLILELDSFAHTVAHDLKSPLHGLIGYASLLADGLDSFTHEELAQYLGTIERYGFKMNNIIDDLLLLASVRSLNEVAIEPLDMELIVEGALSRLDYFMRDHEAGVDIHADAWPLAIGYAPWVEQVWVNYLSNALKYGGEPPRITVGADAPVDGFVRFWVRDQGPGISENDQKMLFRNFSRIGEMKVEGHGLGLSIVQRIVQRLGGEVGVRSQVGVGSEFYFTLPVAAQVIAHPQ